MILALKYVRGFGEDQDTRINQLYLFCLKAGNLKNPFLKTHNLGKGQCFGYTCLVSDACLVMSEHTKHASLHDFALALPKRLLPRFSSSDAAKVARGAKH